MKSIRLKTNEVQAVLKGNKTQIRIPIKESWSKVVPDKRNRLPLAFWVDDSKWVKPAIQPNDVLWVKEKFNDTETTSVIYAADKDFIDYGCKKVDDFLFMENEIKWRPSIHMPREAARLFLKVKGVKVERLQNITNADIKAEGTILINSNDEFDNEFSEEVMWNMAFQTLWNSTIKKQDLDKYGWNVNPYIWIIEFEVTKNEN